MSWREDRPEAVLATLRQPCYEKDFPDCQGGGAMFGSPREFVKILRAVLLAADELASDEEVVPPAQLLRRSTAELLFQPQLSERGIKALQEVSNIPRFNHMLGDMPSEARKDWSLGGMLLLDDIPGGRNKGTLTWGGTPNLTWVSVSQTAIQHITDLSLVDRSYRWHYWLLRQPDHAHRRSQV